MASIKATFSAIESYFQNSGNTYTEILNIAGELLSDVEKYENAVAVEFDKISIQETRATQLYEEIQSTVRYYRSVMDNAEADAERYSEEMDYIRSHPITVTTTDDDGNEHTESQIDYEALRAASRARDEAEATFRRYEEKYDAANDVLHQAYNELYKCQSMKKAIELTLEAIKNDKYEIKKCISVLESESEYNLQNLKEVVLSLESYLNSKSIYMPTGTHYEDYSSHNVSDNITNRQVNSSSISDNSDKSFSEEQHSPKTPYYPTFEGLKNTRQEFTFVTAADGNVEKIFDHPNESVKLATIDQGRACILDGKHYAGICALCDLTTLLNRAGISANVYDVVRYAVDNNICDTYESVQEKRAIRIQALSKEFNRTSNGKKQAELIAEIQELSHIAPGDVGGISPDGAKQIAQHFGLDSQALYNRESSINNLAEYVESGHGVYISVQAGKKRYNPNGWYNEVSGGHALVLNSVVRDSKSNKIKAFYIIDPNGETPSEASIKVSVKELSKYYNERAFITNKIIW